MDREPPIAIAHRKGSEYPSAVPAVTTAQTHGPPRRSVAAADLAKTVKELLATYIRASCIATIPVAMRLSPEGMRQIL